jgi:putative transposase
MIAYGIYLYFNSRSYRCTSRSLAHIIKRSHVSIWKWVQRYAEVADRFRVSKSQVNEIFVDETLLQIDGIDYWLWIAYEPYLNKCIMMHLSRERTLLVCYQFFKKLRSGWKKTYTYRWSKMVQRCLQMVKTKTLCLRY